MFEEQGLIYIFNSESRIYKSDSLVGESLIQKLSSAVKQLAINLNAEKGVTIRAGG